MMIPLLPYTLGVLFAVCDFACALAISSHHTNKSSKSRGVLTLKAGISTPATEIAPLKAGNTTTPAASTTQVIEISITLPSTVSKTTESPKQLAEKEFEALLTHLETQTAAHRVDYSDLYKANNWFYLSVNLFLATILAGYFFSVFLKSYLPNWCPAEDRPSAWVFASLLSLYGLLIGGWFTDLYADIELKIALHGHPILLTSSPPGYENDITTTTIGFMSILTPAATACVIICEMILPMVALTLFIVGEVLRHGANPTLSRRCTLNSQHLVKMCCPLLFAYILGLHLLLSLQHGPVSTEGAWDVAFTDFGVFCIGLTLVSCLFKPAQIELKVEEASRWLSWSRETTVDPSTVPWMLRRFGKKGTFYAAICLTVLFMATISIGVAFECIGVYLTPYIFLEPHGPIPQKFFPFIKDDIEHIVGPNHSTGNSLTTVVSSSTLLVFTGGQANGAMAFVAVFGFAFVCPLANMLCICAAAYKMARRRRRSRRVINDDGSIAVGDLGGEAAAVSHHFKHCDMLDACIVGILIVDIAAAGEGDDGYCVVSQWAIALLMLAELVHYFAFYTVVPAVEFIQSNPDYQLPAATVPAGI